MEPSPEKETNPNIITAPFTKEQVETLNFFQSSGIWHPFTCGKRHDHIDFSPLLIAKEDGWHCEISGCTYTQTWAHSAMADKKLVEDWVKFLEEASRNAKKAP